MISMIPKLKLSQTLKRKVNIESDLFSFAKLDYILEDIESLDPTQTPPRLCLEVCTKQAHRLECPQLIKLNRAKPSEAGGFPKLPFPYLAF